MAVSVALVCPSFTHFPYLQLVNLPAFVKTAVYCGTFGVT